MSFGSFFMPNARWCRFSCWNPAEFCVLWRSLRRSYLELTCGQLTWKQMVWNDATLLSLFIYAQFSELFWMEMHKHSALKSFPLLLWSVCFQSNFVVLRKSNTGHCKIWEFDRRSRYLDSHLMVSSIQSILILHWETLVMLQKCIHLWWPDAINLPYLTNSLSLLP